MSKSNGRKLVKDKIRKSIAEGTNPDMKNKRKVRTIGQDTWWKKKCLKECDSGTRKGVN